MLSLEEIIKGCKQYNKFAQKLLYEKYAPSMKGVCLRYIIDQHTANDLVQEGFLKVFTNIKQYTGKGSFEGWLKRIFINTTISHLRKHLHKSHFLNIDEVEDFTLVDQNSTFSDKEKIKIDRKDIEKEPFDFQFVLSADFSEGELLSVLQKVQDKYRLVFNLHCIENFKHEEIAEMLDIDVGTSRSRLMRARTIIQKELYEMSIEKLSI